MVSGNVNMVDSNANMYVGGNANIIDGNANMYVGGNAKIIEWEMHEICMRHA